MQVRIIIIYKAYVQKTPYSSLRKNFQTLYLRQETKPLKILRALSKKSLEVPLNTIAYSLSMVPVEKSCPFERIRTRYRPLTRELRSIIIWECTFILLITKSPKLLYTSTFISRIKYGIWIVKRPRVGFGYIRSCSGE